MFNAVQVMPALSVFPQNPQPSVTTHSSGSSSDEDPSSGLQVTQADDGVARDSHDGNDGNTVLTINDIEALKKGIINTSASEANAPYTILLLGETGVGKTTLLELFADVLNGKDIDHYDYDILDHTNENDGSTNQSRTNEHGASSNQRQTKEARIYELKRKNGIVLRIIDTPGLADTRGIEQDELHRMSIAPDIQEYIGSVTAVVVVINGTVPRGAGGALSSLSVISPQVPANKFAFMFTNISSPLACNFCWDAIPVALQDARQFQLDNPVALQRKYIELRNDTKMKTMKTGLRSEVKAGEEALGTLASLFDWLDSLEPQKAAGIIKAQNSTASSSPCLHLVLEAFSNTKEVLRNGARKVKRIFSYT